MNSPLGAAAFARDSSVDLKFTELKIPYARSGSFDNAADLPNKGVHAFGEIRRLEILQQPVSTHGSGYQRSKPVRCSRQPYASPLAIVRSRN